MKIIPIRINQRWVIKLLLYSPAAFQISTGVSAGNMPFKDPVITGVVVILMFHTYYLMRLVNSRSISLATLMVLALAWKPFWA